ncbi:hypothetical protein [Aquabacterium sp.]|uniref:hypothetical protein n=1 Tax=Aquabacterium sp. TaxID=1872578 RepID=UPI002BE796F7|nr:hypothetical protein [Aquabacterium sp.]HSW04425.1 hypothetical protein [Aquabacterium sp.]
MKRSSTGTPVPLDRVRPKSARLLEAFSPKLGRTVRFFDRACFDQWTALKPDPKVLALWPIRSAPRRCGADFGNHAGVAGSGASGCYHTIRATAGRPARPDDPRSTGPRSPGFFSTDFLDRSSVRYGDRKIADYNGTADLPRADYESYNHQQPGDPVRLGQVIVQVAAMSEAPLHFLAGSDAVTHAYAAIKRRCAEVDAQAALSVTTDLDH